ncbi:hypothetical protein BJV82DRAFT_588723 [Fennellomyces sp. T-0311]|nr:hypothetical protein BJV82DRAFT_588723 [Fennellomyces sp. T-0311]
MQQRLIVLTIAALLAFCVLAIQAIPIQESPLEKRIVDIIGDAVDAVGDTLEGLAEGVADAVDVEDALDEVDIDEVLDEVDVDD